MFICFSYLSFLLGQWQIMLNFIAEAMKELRLISKNWGTYYG